MGSRVEITELSRLCAKVKRPARVTGMNSRRTASGNNQATTGNIFIVISLGPLRSPFPLSIFNSLL